MAKSIYSSRKTARFNGSLNQSIGCSGLNIMDTKAKAGADLPLQQVMNKTFVLNTWSPFGNTTKGKTFVTARKVDNSALTTLGDKKGSASPRSPGHVRVLFTEAVAPFQVKLDSKIPDLTEERLETKEERISSLRKIPKHRTDPSTTGANF